jgi:hypothetical protein
VKISLGSRVRLFCQGNDMISDAYHSAGKHFMQRRDAEEKKNRCEDDLNHMRCITTVSEYPNFPPLSAVTNHIAWSRCFVSKLI